VRIDLKVALRRKGVVDRKVLEMGIISKQLEEAMVAEIAVPVSDRRGSEPLDSYDFLVKLLRLSHDAYPGRDAHGVLPLMIVGHKSMDESRWRTWVRENGVAHYGPAYVERVLEQGGIELKEMLPTAGFGRQMRHSGRRAAASEFSYLDRAGEILTMVEKWPSLYNLVAEELAEEVMTLSEFVDRVMNLPSPLELGRGAFTTLGDILLPPGAMVLPGER
jgi:hypothetical protein